MASFLSHFKDIFIGPKESETLHQLHSKVEKHLTNHSADKLATLSCVAGLLARIAFVDMKLDQGEADKMSAILCEWGQINKDEASWLTQIAFDEVKSLGGLENHLYCHPLNHLLSKEQRQDLLAALFAIAASDDSVSGEETEEIRLVAKGLLLEPSDFIAAKLSVKDYLAVLK